MWFYKVITRYPHSPCRNNQDCRHSNYKKMLFEDLPGGTVGKNPPANAGDMSLIPGRFHMLQATKAHVPQLLKPLHLEPVLCNKRSHCDEKPVHHKEK